MFTKILVPLDGSIESEQAVGLAQCIALNSNASITLVQAVSESDVTWMMNYGGAVIESVEQVLADSIIASTNYLSKFADRLRATGVQNVDVRAMRGRAVEVIPALASDGFDLIVMNTHGRTGLARTVLGSVAMAVVHDVTIPVLLTNQRQAVNYTDGSYCFERILVPLDGTPFAEEVLPFAIALAQAQHGRLFLLKIMTDKSDTEVYTTHEVSGGEDNDYVIGDTNLTEYRYLEDVAGRYIPEGVAYTAIACGGKPAMDIVAASIDHKCQLIAMSTHARTGLGRIVEGSVTEQVVSQTNIPVLTLHGQ